MRQRGVMLACVSAVLWFGIACSHAMIPGTKVRATKDTREVFEVLQQARIALEERNQDKLVAYISPRYFEDLGTPNSNDDFGYKELTQVILPKSFAVAKEVHVAFTVYDIVVVANKAYAEVRYTSRIQLEMPAGSQWTTNKDFDRIEFERAEDGKWLITKGL